MRLALRFVLPLLLALTLLAYLSVFLADKFTRTWFVRDLNIRTRFAAIAMEQGLVPLIKHSANEEIRSVMNRVTLDERLYAAALCDAHSNMIYRTVHFPEQIVCRAFQLQDKPAHSVINLPSGPVHVSAAHLHDGETPLATLIFVHDLSFAVRRSGEARFYVFLFFLLTGGIVSLITVAIARWSWRGWMQNMRTIIQERGEVQHPHLRSMPEMLPLLKDLRSLITDIESDRRLQEAGTVIWNPETLKDILVKHLSGENILVVANREPYIHNRRGDDIEVQIPASGVVTALEPVMKACSGTWIAHGSGSADREVVDAQDRVAVPPGEPLYNLRRVWLTEEEENGYYYGFANEGIWPLCHIAHTRPVFRSTDWEFYNRANRRFADAVIREAQTKTPVILVQDYHFAVLPALIRKQIPNAVIITFWHIPWPNPEAFGICPWRREILEGLLGSTILGFHTRLHTTNFIETVDRFLECRIDRSHATVSFQGELTSVKSYPISIAWPPPHAQDAPGNQPCRSAVIKRHNLSETSLIAVGVERLDYTKGILERFLAVERMLDIHPQWRGQFTMIQIAAPSRSKLDAYRQFRAHAFAEAERINNKFGELANPPILVLERHHSPAEVLEYLRAANVCLVTSLHDGMNLVAKEFVGARSDLGGVLILSMFAGASRELPEALIVNPYNIDQCAQAIDFALQMPLAEQNRRMQSMREQIQQFNVYRWAGRMLIDAAQVRKKEQLSREISEFRLQED